MTNLTTLETMFLSKSFVDELGYFDSQLDYAHDPKWRGVFASLIKKNIIFLEEEREWAENLYSLSREVNDIILYNDFEE